MQKQGYDGYSGLGSQKQGIIEPITIEGQPPSLGLRFKPLRIGPPSTTVPTCKTMDVLNDEKASKDIPLETKNPLASEHNPNDLVESVTHISTFNQIPFNTNDDISSSYPEPLDWDQRGPPIFDQFDNDDTLIIEFEGIMTKDHKEVVSPKEKTLAYFGEATPLSSYKAKREKDSKHRSLGENQKVPLDYKKSKAKKLPRIQNEKYDAMNISVPVFNMPQKSFGVLSVSVHAEGHWSQPSQPSLISLCLSPNPAT